MATFYSGISRFPVSVDCVIFGINEGILSILLTKRAFEPERGRWSLMGGFVTEDEGVDEAAKRVLEDLTDLTDIYMQQVGTFGAIDRDPGERVISVAYCALINVDQTDDVNLRKRNAVWTPLAALPRLGFDHKEMVDRALQMVKLKFSFEPIAFQLLPHHFTLTALQQLYETVHDEIIDKRNFRKRALENPCIEKTELIDKTSSRRGAALYRFNASKYNPVTFRL